MVIDGYCMAADVLCSWLKAVFLSNSLLKLECMPAEKIRMKTAYSEPRTQSILDFNLNVAEHSLSQVVTN